MNRVRNKCKISANFAMWLKWCKCAIHSEHAILLDILNVQHEWKIYTRKNFGEKKRTPYPHIRSFILWQINHAMKKNRIWNNKKCDMKNIDIKMVAAHKKECDVSVNYTCIPLENKKKYMYSIGNMVTLWRLIHTIHTERAIVSFANAWCNFRKSIVFVLQQSCTLPWLSFHCIDIWFVRWTCSICDLSR